MYKIPNKDTKRIRQLNLGDLTGELFVTKNIDLSKQGLIKLSHPAIATMTTDNDADFDDADSMFKSDEGLWVLSDNMFFTSQAGIETLTDRGTDTDVPTPSVEEDGTYFNNTEVVSDGTTIHYKSGTSTWTSVSVSLSSANPTCMDVFDYFNSLLVGNNNVVKMIDTAWTVIKTLTLPAIYQVTSICTNNNVAYIGTRHRGNGEAKLFLWDGTSTAHNGSFGVDTYDIFSVKKYDMTCVVITSKGELLPFNGAGFGEPLAVLPPFIKKDTNWADALNNYSKVSNRGMIVDGKDIYIRLDSETTQNYREYDSYFTGGVWKYSPENGLHCISTPSFTKVSTVSIATSAIDTTTNIITVTSAPVTGTPMTYKPSATLIGGLSENTLYYVIKVDDIHIKVATSYTNAIAGTAVDITSQGATTQYLNFFLVNDYGWHYADKRGSIELLTSAMIGFDTNNDRLVFSANLFAKQATTKKTVFNVMNKLLPNRGYFITPRLTSNSLEDNIVSLSLKYKPLSEDDSIVIKYKNIDKRNVPFGSLSTSTPRTGIWSDTNTFTTTVDMSNAVVGDEIEIMAGVGSGFLSHIESLSNNAGTWTVNLTDSFIFASANDIMYFYFDNFTYLDTITSSNQTGQEYKEIAVAKNSKFIQFKIELRGVEVTIEELNIENKKHK